MRRTVEILVAIIGAALVLVVIGANQSWLDHHFLPSFFVPRRWYVLIESVVRITIAVAGASLVRGRARLARLLTHDPMMSLSVVVAASCAVGSGELALRWIHLPPTEWLVREEEPRRQDDPRLGWILTPSRTGRAIVSGRTLEYATDGSGYRVRRVGEPVDVERPTLIFAGESVMFGEGLAWDETIPAQVGAMLGLQSANVAVHGYSTDQIYMRLANELPRFRYPVAVISIFMTELFGRNLDSDRPHLGPGLVWQPAERKSRLMALASLLVPYRRESTVERGVRVTHDAFLAMTELARRRGALGLVVVPQFGDEDASQRAFRERILTAEIPVALVHLNPDWRLTWDRHPNADAALAVATAIASRLHAR